MAFSSAKIAGIMTQGGKKMTRLRLWTTTMMLMIALGFAACGGGGGAKVTSQQSTYTTTLGQELKDLEDSYQKGIITKEQYEAAKKKLIEQRTK
jgi:hypothetical protein